MVQATVTSLFLVSYMPPCEFCLRWSPTQCLTRQETCWVQAAVPSRRPDLAADRRAHLGLLASAMFEAQLAEAAKQSRNYVIDQGK